MQRCVQIVLSFDSEHGFEAECLLRAEKFELLGQNCFEDFGLFEHA